MSDKANEQKQEKISTLLKRLETAEAKKDNWQSHWQECYEYAFPMRENAATNSNQIGDKKGVNLYDATACDAVDQLSASMLAELTPPWSKWFGLSTGFEISDEEKDLIGKDLDEASEKLLSNFDRSNFSVEIHQCYLDLVTIGTASLLFEEEVICEKSAFKFTAIPIKEVILEESPNGRLDTTFRKSEVTLEKLKTRFPEVEIPLDIKEEAKDNPDYKVLLIESVLPRMTSTGQAGYEYTSFVTKNNFGVNAFNEDEAFIVREGVFDISPFINFRWLKAPGEIYGRSPVMKALPDIKTANKVVELVLKNASISTTGIWQADDDGVINPANIKLVPGAIIPKAVGSKGLTPLDAPGKFDVSQLVLEDLRARIRKALLADKLGQVNNPNMTATEVLERSSDMSRILGAVFGRLQAELLTPLINRAVNILKRRGEISFSNIDGRLVELQYKSPLATNQSKIEAMSLINILTQVSAYGELANSVIDFSEAIKWIGKSLSLPPQIIKNQSIPNPTGEVINE